MAKLSITLVGNPRTKKNSLRLVKVRGRTIPIQSARHDSWYKDAAKQLKELLKNEPNLPITTPVHVQATFFRVDRRADLVNLMQALADLLEKEGVLKNDRQIVSWDGSRQEKDTEHPRTEVTIVDISEEDSPGR